MLNEQTIQKLYAMKLIGMAEGMKRQMETNMDSLSFEERFAMLVDAQHLHQENKRMKRLMKSARLKLQASLEDIDYRTPRGLDKSVMMSLGSCDWIRKRRNIIITGPTGTGKTYIACALAHKGCREGYGSLYVRCPKLYYSLSMAKADGSYARAAAKLAKTPVLILDDFGLAAMTDSERRDLLEIIDDRHESSSTIITSQLPVEHWHEVIGDPTIADAILDRLVHNAHKIKLTGKDSMRRKKKDD
jgi:DNA replication protein DnaC